MSLFPMKICSTFIVFLVLCFPLAAVVPPDLIYDQSSGKVVGFDLSTNDAEFTPSQYNDTAEYWGYPYQFIGRLVYNGDQTTLSFNTVGSTATGTQNPPWFYFTHLNNGVADFTKWREFFLVAKIRVIKHGSSGHTNHGNGQNIVITSPSSPFVLPGAGSSSEEVSVGEYGYDSDGNGGTRTSKNYGKRYKYKYQYKYLWVDLTLVRTKRILPTSGLPLGIFECNINAVAGTGPIVNFHLVGENSTTGVSDFLFTVYNVAPSPFPFADLNNKNNVGNSLKVGELVYFSSTDAATLELSSSPGGSAIDFRLYSGTVNIPYKVAFDSVNPSEGLTGINTIHQRFFSQYTFTPSPIGGTTNVHTIEGDIRLFLSNPVNPLSGTYTSTIYCILTN